VVAKFGTPDSDKKPKYREADKGKLPIDLLKPGSDRHSAVKKYLLTRLEASERSMGKRYSRWRLNELQFQAYISLAEHEKILKSAKQSRSMPEITSLVIPYSYSTIMAIVTYLLQVFAGSDPIFRVNATKSESMMAQEYMELALKHNTTHTRMVLKIFQFLLDSQIYNLGVMRNLWSVEERFTTVLKPAMMPGPQGLMPDFSQPRTRQREMSVVHEGTNVTNVDPFMFFPDPRVSPAECSRKAEFVFWRDFTGMHILEEQQAKGMVKYLDDIGDRPKAGMFTGEADVPQSNRNNATKEESTNPYRRPDGVLEDYVQLDQGSVVVIPSKLGLGDSDLPEKWLFTIANKNQIIQAEPLDLDHGLHPVCVTEPYSMGYSPGGMSMVEMLEPIQEGMSWLLNSHIHNIRGIINNSFILDPNAIDMTSFKDGRPGKLIKLKPSAVGRDVRTVIQQLQMYDATAQHVTDIEVLRRLGDTISAVNDNLRGVQQAGGRKTATEVRTATENGASRLVMQARLISAQAMVDQAEQMCINMQQLTTEPFFMKVVGADGMEKLMQIGPENLIGDFNFPVTDGTLPLDKVAILDVWKEIFQIVATNPMLQQMYNVDQIFDFVAELSGARNLDKFKLQPPMGMGGMGPPGMPGDPAALAAQAGAGNVVPIFGGPGPNGGRGIPDFAAAGGGAPPG
jgi:hypothetical protein